ncbi:MAG TPA: tRNA (adenosine(37)-N6)-dimethylallyltransferase MiaA [Rhizomicrobium sp.]|jgi:tRNA dimethylallyltransferase|nr:tRNA (adenosine(37)-N6)-dimethylallyltransferase MiaA [Rhizomicrobium sp.]
MTIDAVLIAGPTASGKSAQALALAEHIGGMVINADSMQVYREAPILTAQPDKQAQAQAPHRLYGHVSARELYSVGRYEEDARRALAEARACGKVPIFVGGTGLYFSALTEGLARIPPIPTAVRDKARALLVEIGVEALHQRLKVRDPETAAALRPSDPQRNLRAYEVFDATGRPLIAWQRETQQPVLEGLRLARFVLDPPRPWLREHIAQRFEMMVGQGGLEEALALADLDSALPAAKLLGLRPLIAHARGELDQKAATGEAVTATRQFAKRQMTWFRNRMADYVWFSPSERNIITAYEPFLA